MVTCGVWWDDPTGFERGRQEVEDEEAKIPNEDEKVDDGTDDFVDKSHGCLVDRWAETLRVRTEDAAKI